ncbi:hypothetical protein Bhyg_03327, partial [Pseudolycoriella hygida]
KYQLNHQLNYHQQATVPQVDSNNNANCELQRLESQTAIEDTTLDQTNGTSNILAANGNSIEFQASPETDSYDNPPNDYSDSGECVETHDADEMSAFGIINMDNPTEWLTNNEEFIEMILKEK